MKIRSQFLILIAGIVIVPLIVVLSIYGMVRYKETKAVELPTYDSIAALAGDSFNRDDWARISDYITHKPSSIEFMVLNRDRVIIYSSVDEWRAGTTLSDTELLSYIRRTGDHYFYQLDFPMRLSDDGTLIVARIFRLPKRPPSPLEWVLGSVSILLAILFLFSSIMSVFIARSITRSVTVLEEATRRIAAGELDVAVDVKGSNEITSLTASLNRMRLSLKDEEIRRARFIMGVTHDLKTPLALIKGYAEAIGDGVADDAESREKSVEIIGSKVDQLVGMIDDLIEFVRVDTGEWRRRLEPVPFGLFLSAYGKRVVADAELLDRRAEVKIDLPADLRVPLDERLALRALENLVNNALRYTSAGGSVRLSASLDSERRRAIVEVADNGPGISGEDLPHIFDPFYRGSSSRREQGMGLGLSVVKGVADSHGWEISVESAPGEGSSFRIAIPV